MHRRIAVAFAVLGLTACGRLDACAPATSESPKLAAGAQAEGRPRAQEIVGRWVRMSREERIEELRRTLRRSPDDPEPADLEADYDTCEARTRAHPNYEKATPGQRYLYFMACMLKQGWERADRP